MVDLPEVPRRFVTTKAPTSAVSAADVAAPFAMLGKAAGELGEAVEEASVVLARRAAERATVTVGPDGSPQVETMPDFSGRAGVAYNRIAKYRALAEASPAIDRQIIAKRQEFVGRPQEFQEWAATYVDELTAKQDDPALANSIRQMALQKADAAYTGLAAEQHRLAIQRGNVAMDARLKDLADDMEVIARDGGARSEGFASRLKDFDALLDEKVRNPAIAFPKEQAERFRDEVLTRAHGAAILDGTEQVYRTQGADAAKAHLRGAVRELGATLKQGATIERQGLAWIRTEESGLRGERDAINREWSMPHGLRSQVQTLKPEELESFAIRAAGAGAFRVANEARSWKATLDYVRTIPPEERANVVRTGTVSSALVNRIVGAESGGRTDARAETSSAEGPGQFVKDTWRDLITRRRPDLVAGKSDAEVLALRRDPAVSREMVALYAQENTDRLRAAGLPVNDGALYLAHFLGPGDAVKVLSAPAGTPVQGLVAPPSIAANAGIFERNPTAGQLVTWAGGKVAGGAPPGAVDLTQSREGIRAIGLVKEQLAKDFGVELAAFEKADRKLSLPTVDEVEGLVEKAAVIGTPAQKQRVAELLAEARYGREFRQLSGPKRAELISAANAEIQTGGSQFERGLRDKLVEADRAITAAYEKAPYAAHARYAEGAKALPAPDFNNPEQFGALIAAKSRQQDQIRADQGRGPFSVFDPPEAEAFRNWLPSAQPQQIAQTFGALASLDDDKLIATLGQKDVKDAVTALARSTDPAKFTAAMSSLDQLYGRLGVTPFGKLFGEETTHGLMTWQANLRYMDEKQLAAERAKVLDPGVAEVRKKRTQEGLELARKSDADEITKLFDTSWPVTPGFVAAGITGTKPEAPAADVQAVSGLTRDAFVGDFQQLFARRYAETDDKVKARDQAIDMMKLKWTRSEVNGGRLMLRAPESAYPAVDGSHKWMTRQLEADLEARYGPMVGEVGPAGALANYTYALIPDRQTESEAQTGKPLRYMVAVTRLPQSSAEQERTDVVRDDDGKPLRYRFDPTAAQAEARARFTERRAAAGTFMQPFSLGAP